MHPVPAVTVTALVLALAACTGGTPTPAGPPASSDATTASAPPAGELSGAPAAATLPAEAPRNVVVLIGDGMGFNAIDLGSLYQYGTTYRQVAVDPATGAVVRAPSTPSQVYERFPVQVAASTYSVSGRASYAAAAAWGSFAWVNSGATDSAAAATALATGVKTTNGTVGIAPDGTVLEDLTQRADALGKATGVVTSVPFSHATPAGFAAHNPDRHDYAGVTHEYLTADYLDVVMGGGHPFFDDSHQPRATGSYGYVSQADWQRLAGGETGFTLLQTRAELEALADGVGPVPERVFGAVEVGSTLQQRRAGAATQAAPYAAPRNDVPDLATLARGALTVLGQDPDGFALMVEGGAIDWSGHDNLGTTSVEEQVDFNHAVEAVVDWVEAESSWAETLVVVTADHETGYLSGPGADPTWTALAGSAGLLPGHTWHTGGHTNQLVPVYAKGPGAALLDARATSTDPVRGRYLDNTDIPRVLLDQLWTTEPRPFTDVAPTDPFASEIARLAADGVVGGYADGTFRPLAPVNRDAMAAFLYRLAAPDGYAPPTEPMFDDVGPDHPFYTEVSWLAEQGVATGWTFDDGRTVFRPGEPVSREATAAFLHRLAGAPPATGDAPSFADVWPGHPFADAIAWLAGAGITTGWDVGGGVAEFRPGALIERQAMAAFLVRFADRSA